ncbi:uncharacterized protein SAPINGB_P006052 [Magnusiomyces paraingens]|uniref:NAD-dependent epimerase/dehydratase domain-containing protein n=1 Tax=Magnusiomyces paraingens TaxID=2606893 RepID=A0A5E8C512_9ASCO|nr:uncharacterized protein SAPINGB_P006052 [Saprochaete ingens]VVT58130.1 unnamed protein product [Saprochaete ingens]
MIRSVRLVSPKSLAPYISARGIQTFEPLVTDIKITRNGKTIIAQGTGGRSSRTGYTATVFGSNGFLGSHLVSRLARHGTITVAPFREEMKKRHLKVAGDLGVVNFVEFDFRNVQSIEDAVKNSDIVYNLIGREYETKNFSYDDVHVEGAKRIAEAVDKYNVPRFVHVSAFNANSSDKVSQFNRTKGLGEEIVREIVPHTTIVRPSTMYGNSDKFLNQIASKSRLLVANNNQEKLRPVHVVDVAAALEQIGYDDATTGKTFELYGPKELTMAEIQALVQGATSNEQTVLNLPKQLYLAFAKATQLIYWPTLSPDQVERMFIDQVIDPNAETFASLGIEPAQLESLVIKYVRHWRSYLHLQDTVDATQALRKEREYIHIIDQ